MSYKITSYTRQQAKALGVTVKPSTRPNKKIDVYRDIASLRAGKARDNQRIASVGDIRYNDYPTYIKECGQEYASTRRTLYKKRHAQTRTIKDSPSYWADRLLW